MDIINFRRLEKTDKAIFDELYGAGYYESSKHNFTNFYMWRDRYNIQLAIEDGIIFIISDDEKTLKAWQPVCAENQRQFAIEKIFNWCAANKGDKNFEFYALEKFFVEELKKYSAAQFEFVSDRNTADYVYLAQDLINLSGRKFHGKKNHLRQFYKDYPTAEYLPLTTEIIPRCRDELDRWYKMRLTGTPYDEILAYENRAIHEIFDDYDFFKLKGGAILLGGRIVAFTFGEKLNSDTAVIHVEKADPEIRGAYAAINQNFVENEWANMTHINREEDLGLDGLRQAKESYRPVKMIDKFDAKILV